MRKARALWHTSASQSQIKEVELSANPACVVKSLYSLISTGTERLVSRGQVPHALYASMKVPYMEGEFSFPVKYGYSLVGEVQEGPEEILGKKVHLLHPHQDYCRVQASELTVLPGEVPPLRATLASNLETALNSIWDSGVSVGDRVLVVGFGIIGSLTARLLQSIAGVEVWVYDLDAQRSELASASGFHIVDRMLYDFDIAFHCSSSSKGLQSCIDHIGFEGKVMEMSWYGEQAVELQLGGSFHQQRKQIISSQVSSIPSNHRARWDFNRRKAVVMELLKNPAYDQHLGEQVPFDKVPALFGNIRKGSLSALSWVIAYDQ